MAYSQTLKLGELVRTMRRKKHLSARELAARVGIAHSNIVRLEDGSHSEPHPRILGALARELDIELADLYVLASIPSTEHLPSFRLYLRSRYPDLPPTAAAELEVAFQEIAERYGYSSIGPAPGEDEG